MEQREALSIMAAAENVSRWASVRHDELLKIERRIADTGEGLSPAQTTRVLDIGKQHMLLVSAFAVLTAQMICQATEREVAQQRNSLWRRGVRAWRVLMGRE